MAKDVFPRLWVDEQHAALESAGYTTGTLHDKWGAFWEANSSLAAGTYVDHLHDALSSFSGEDAWERFRSWCYDTGGSSSFADNFLAKLLAGISLGGAQFVDGSGWEFVEGGNVDFVN